MKSRDEFVARWSDELSGMILAAFAEERATGGDFASKGRYMIQAMKRARGLLERQYDDLEDKQPLPVRAAPLTAPVNRPANGVAAVKPAVRPVQ